ncbi:hypothetical protein B0H13DRAFT_2364491 [Mycena leptocephala]|nr:hypothetical protein B0H13DRAFT_2364491 [Mycena leptocephala]
MRTLLCVRRKPTSAPCAPAHHPFLLPRPPRPRNWIHTSSTFWEPRPSQNGCLFRKCYLRITCRLPSRLGHPTSASRMAGQAAPTLADRCADPSLNVWSGPTALSRLLSSLYQPSRPGCIGVARCFESSSDLRHFVTSLNFAKTAASFALRHALASPWTLSRCQVPSTVVFILGGHPDVTRVFPRKTFVDDLSQACGQRADAIRLRCVRRPFAVSGPSTSLAIGASPISRWQRYNPNGYRGGAMSRSARGLYAAWNIRRRETLRLPHAVHICKLPLLLRGSDDPCYATSRISSCLSQLCTLLHFHDIDPVSASHAPPLTCLTWCTSNSSACSSAGYHPVPPPVACGFELARAYIRASRWDVRPTRRGVGAGIHGCVYDGRTPGVTPPRVTPPAVPSMHIISFAIPRRLY